MNNTDVNKLIAGGSQADSLKMEYRALIEETRKLAPTNRLSLALVLPSIRQPKALLSCQDNHEDMP